MWRAVVEPGWDLDAWRVVARHALRAGLSPDAIDWAVGDGGLLGGASVLEAPAVRESPSVPATFLQLARDVLAHRDPRRHALLYALLWRIAEGEPRLLGHETDPDVRRAMQLQKAVRRDAHKMEAFVRFREVPGEANAFVAWYEPDHQVLDLCAPFFMKRFAGMRWAILTPDRRAVWDGESLAMGEGGAPTDVPADDAGEALWRRYYASIFNPARLNPRAMRAEMPQRFWKHLPEARDLPQLMRDAAPRVADMVARAPEAARRRIPAPVFDTPVPVDDLDALHAAVRGCRACPLWQPATQAVPGEGPLDSRIVFVGEQPGDEEDLRGRPFTGPAGRLFDQALLEAGLDRASAYVTNAVKHFKFEPRGKRRLHKRANAAEQKACSGWLHRELELVRPERVVCLGATAATALLGSGFPLLRERGRWHRNSDGMPVLATVHPSWVLRQPAADYESAYRSLVEDLKRVVVALRDDPAAA
ncbi:uracil-DNA glycosylase [Lysobacter xinjiangensis]|uniref:Type-4 uracil-DNA glycosylase n=1 Tax=Cognatilysobacter xinjiangensis TaxID=546892 RepID=A0ABQ3BW93_9GAMM|nr:UdgX family uracil-DNA binding protein [Lysobacter xinjiangensis]GGZ59763.1 uracil-DNA glycosylase [Lysobacter xinjiangensis]